MRLTTSKVLKMIRVNEMSLSKPQSQVLQFLRQYIRGLTPKELQSFLRYVTGSSLPVVQHINVIFHPQAGGYTGFQDFRVQLDNTLQSPEAWQFTSA